MNKLLSTLSLFLLIASALQAQFGSPNDCVGGSVVCTSEDIEFNPIGEGFDDFEGSNNGSGCIAGGEQNSAWFYFEIDINADPDQELGFTLTPFGGNAEDYDFALWGPDVVCDSLGDPVRCSYADDGCEFCPQTGMGMDETDESEGPGGNGFVSTIIVQPGEGYYLMVDNFNGTSNGFNLEWTGDAAEEVVCNPPPCSVTLDGGDDVAQCAGSDPFDLALEIIGNGDPYDISWEGTNGGTAFLDDPTAIQPTVTLPADFDGEIIYTVTVISADGECEEQASITVTVNPIPDVMIEDHDTDLCPADDPLQLIGTPPGGVWGGAADASGQVDPEGLPPGPIEVSYTFTDGIGCSDDALTTITILPEPEIMFTELDPLCSIGDPVELEVTPSGGDWLDPVDGSTLDPADLDIGENILTYTVTNPEGCTADGELTVTVEEPIPSQIVGDEFLCTDDPITFYDGVNPGGTWSGVAGPVGDVDPQGLGAGSFDIIYSSPPLDCNIPDTLTLTINDPPFAVVEEQVVVCNGGDMTTVDFDVLVVGGDVGGFWTDLDNSGASGTFPMLDFDGVEPDVYDFLYTTNSALQGCDEATVITRVVVEECDCPSLSVIDPDSICHDLVDLNLDELKITTEDGSWAVVSEPDGLNPAMLSGALLTGVLSDTGLYVFRFTLSNPQADCPDSVEIDVYLSATTTVDLADTLGACNSTDGGSFPSMLNLYDAVLDGDATGSWRDVDGSGAVGDFDALDFAGVDPGVYRFAYESAAAQMPCSQVQDTLIVEVFNCECPDLSLMTFDTVCSDGFVLDLDGFLMADSAGTWTITDGPGGASPPLIIDSEISGSDVDAGRYELTFTMLSEPPAGCPRGIIGFLEVNQAPVLALADTIDVCNVDGTAQFPTRINLFDAILSGDDDGQWTDFDGSGASGLFTDFSFEGVDPGLYTFIFETDVAEDPCEDISRTMIIRVNDCDCPSVALSGRQIRCVDDADVNLNLLNVSGNTGTWEIVNAPGGGDPATISGTDFIGTNRNPGLYILQFRLDMAVPDGCPDSNRTEILIEDPAFAEIAEIVPICNSDANGNETRLAFNNLIEAGPNTGMWEDLDGSGASGVLPVLNFDGVLPGDYQFSYTLMSDFPCDDFVDTLIVRVRDCACPPIDASDPDDLCLDMLQADLSAFIGAGEMGAWEIDIASGATVDASNVLDLSTAVAGEYDIIFRSSRDIPDDCPDSVLYRITLVTEANAGVERGDTSICMGSIVSLDLSTRLSNADAGGRWSYLGTEQEVRDALNTTTGELDLSGLAAMEMSFEYLVTGESPCQDAVATVNVELLALPVAEAGDDQEINCSMTEVQLGSVGDPSLQYLWTLDGEVDPVGDEPTLTADRVGIYTLLVTNDAGCMAQDQVTVSANADVVTGVILDVTSPPCSGEAAGSFSIIEVTGGTEPYEFFLDDSPIDAMGADMLSAGEYTLMIRDAIGCELEETVEILQGGGVDIDLGPDLQLAQDESVNVMLDIVSGTADSIVWKLGDSILCEGCLDLIRMPLVTEQIVVEAYDANGCVDRDDITLLVQVLRRVFIPNIFSPNSDGVNDVWFVDGAAEVESIESAQVFDRWGSLVYDAQNLRAGDPSAGWTGLKGDQLLPDGVYVYQVLVRFRDGTEALYSGDITMIR